MPCPARTSHALRRASLSTSVIVAGGLCIYHGPDREVLCASCMEPSGTCTLTGGREPCDGAADAAALVAEAAAAPTITIQTGAAT